MSKVSVYIPTFNRSKLLGSQLDRLIPQLNDVKLTILDNASDEPIKHLIPPQVNYLRNSSNIGAIANIMRCFELCDTDWLWVCSDDDPILPDAISKINHLIDLFPDACFISTSSPLVSHLQNSLIFDTTEFIKSFPSIDRIFWITGGIYNVQKLKHFYKVAYFIPSAVPHTVLVFMGLEYGVPVGISNLVISGHNDPIDLNQRWNLYEILTYISDLVDLPISLRSKETIASSLENCILNFDFHFLQLCKSVIDEVHGIDDLILLFGSRWAKIFTTLKADHKNYELIARLQLLRNKDNCKTYFSNLSQNIKEMVRPIFHVERFHRL